jgi:hypothetical protein
MMNLQYISRERKYAMGKVGGSVEINVSVENVIDFLEDWHNAEK